MNLLREFISNVLSGKLLLELRNFPPSSKPPADATYFARLVTKGYVIYLRDVNGVPEKPEKYSDAWFVTDGAGTDYESTPDEIKKFESLVSLGLVKKETHYKQKKGEWKPECFSPEISFKYAKKRPGVPCEKWQSVDDVPDEVVHYRAEYATRHRIVKVDTKSNVIDLDTNYLEELNRRGGGRPGSQNREGPTYVIPSGSVAFENNQLDLQKLLKHLLQDDSRVTADYKIINDEKYRKSTLGDVIGQPREIDVALSGRAGKGSIKLYAYHGTSLDRWQIIQKGGLRANKQGVDYVDQVKGWSEKNIYLTFSPLVAENYATRQAIWDGSKTCVVLKIEIPDVTQIVADEDAMSAMFMPTRDYKISLISPKFSIPDWRRSYVTPEDEAKEKAAHDEKYKTPEVRVIRADTEHSYKYMLSFLSGADIAQDSEYAGLMHEIWEHMKSQTKKSIKAGTFAYTRQIPANKISLFESYPLTRFKTVDSDRSKKFLGFDEYQDIRKKTQQAAKHYD